MSLTPFALALLGAESLTRRMQTEQMEGDAVDAQVQDVSDVRPARTARRPTSYYNSFQTSCSTSSDEPPSYGRVARQRPSRVGNGGNEVLPKYTCTVSAEAKVLLCLESSNPLHDVSECEWKEVYLVLRGTLLSFHRPKDNGPGRLLRSYTLQHAEIGLASDAHHSVLVPQTRLARLIPTGTRQKAWQRDPDLFKPIRQHIIRLRAETDQILLADESEDRIQSLVNSISAGIDISQPIDERAIPRQCTVPRRRRRPRANATDDLNDPGLLAEQERIMREMYPSFAESGSSSTPELGQIAAPSTEELPADNPTTPIREEDDLDMAAIREDFAVPSTRRNNNNQRPTASRQNTSSSVNSTFTEGMMYSTASTNFDTSGKWEPPHTRTPQQIQRYVRRCMPVLLADSMRASDILICNGKRVKVNWRMELLEEWELRPPSYKSHRFSHDLDLERTQSLSQHSAAPSVTQLNAAASASLGGESEDAITPVEMSLATLELAKLRAIESADKPSPIGNLIAKDRGSNHTSNDIHGVVFCF